MNLREIIGDIEQLSDDLVIFASKNGEWDLAGPAATVLSSDAERIGISLENLTYFLEVEIAKEVIEAEKQRKERTKLSEREVIDAILYYVDNDAYIE
jgi:hypothetical protein